MRHRLATLIILVALAGLLAGCHPYYELTIENATDQELVVSVLEQKFTRRPCSLGDYYAIAGPSSGFSVEAWDASGKAVYSASITPQPQPGGRLPLLYVRISTQPNVCPTPISESFQLLVINRMDEPVKVSMGGFVHVVAAKSTETLGPIQGNWREGYKAKVSDLKGRARVGPDLDVSYDADFDLGKVPEMRVYVRSGWNQPR